MRSLLIAALMLAPLPVRGAGDAPLDRATLRGLKSVNVVLDRLDPQLSKGGLTQADFESRLQSRLKEARIPVDAAASDFVALRIVAVRGNRGPMAVALTIALYQPVLLVRDREIRTSTSTWEVETVLLAEAGALRQASMEAVDELAGRFIEAYRSVNAQ